MLLKNYSYFTNRLPYFNGRESFDQILFVFLVFSTSELYLHKPKHKEKNVYIDEKHILKKVTLICVKSPPTVTAITHLSAPMSKIKRNFSYERSNCA